MKNIFPLLIFLSSVSLVFAQENTATFGIQYKPVFSVPFLSKDVQTISENNITYKLTQPGGHCFGMVIRRGFSKGISLETGINTTKRKYKLTIADSTFSGTSSFSIISYEIPVSLLVYIRTGKQTYMNASFGAVIDMFPSDITTRDSNFVHHSLRKSVMDAGMLANLGWEYRTKKSGYLYFGVSYHRLFRHMYETEIRYLKNNEVKTNLLGTYVTADIRYFFHEEPLKKKDKKKKSKPISAD